MASGLVRRPSELEKTQDCLKSLLPAVQSRMNTIKPHRLAKLNGPSAGSHLHA